MWWGSFLYPQQIGHMSRRESHLPWLGECVTGWVHDWVNVWLGECVTGCVHFFIGSNMLLSVSVNIASDQFLQGRSARRDGVFQPKALSNPTHDSGNTLLSGCSCVSLLSAFHLPRCTVLLYSHQPSYLLGPCIFREWQALTDSWKIAPDLGVSI